MDVVGLDLAEQAFVVGDEHDAHVRPLGADLLQPGRHHPQRIDVEARIGLVQNGHVGFKQCELQDLVPLALAAAEALVEVAVHE